MGAHATTSDPCRPCALQLRVADKYLHPDRTAAARWRPFLESCPLASESIRSFRGPNVHNKRHRKERCGLIARPASANQCVRDRVARTENRAAEWRWHYFLGERANCADGGSEQL